MCPGTGVGIIFGSLDYAGSNRVILNIFANCPQITVAIDNRGMVSAFPEPPSSSIFPIKIFTITEGNTLHHLGKSLYLGGSYKHVDMVRHEAVSKNGSFFLF